MAGQLLPVAVCLLCEAGGVPLVCLAREGALQSVCKRCFHLAEVRRLLKAVQGVDSLAIADASLEELYTFLREAELAEALRRHASEEGEGSCQEGGPR